jgi:diguanylate cyclase
MFLKYPQSKDKARYYAHKAMERIEQESLAPTPNNFELWYVYFAGLKPEVTRAIDIFQVSDTVITEEKCQEIYQRYISDAHNQEVMRRTGDQIQDTIKGVTGVVENTREATHDYSDTLNDFTQRITGEESPDEIKSMLSEVEQDTNKMLEQNEKLEDELNQSSKVMEELRRDLELVRREALTDGLTGLSNRKSFDAEIERMVNEAQKEESTISILMLDIDHFKSFNDNYGHQIGDQVLRLLARTLTEGIKGKDRAFRYGGEEFVILLPETNLTSAVAVANSLRKALASKDVINRASGEKLGRISMSIGAAEYFDKESVESLIERADSALYTAKQNGRNQVAAAPSPSSAA